jgi:hypothetical protein
MTDETQTPTEEEIESYIGDEAKPNWHEIRQFIRDNYALEPETVFYGKKYGWTIRYRRSGKTLCSLFPEKGCFTALIVLGSKEAEKALSIRDELGSKTRRILGATEQLRDVRWLWLRPRTRAETEDIKKLLRAKRRPKMIDSETHTFTRDLEPYSDHPAQTG